MTVVFHDFPGQNYFISKLIKVFYTCLYKQNTVKTSLNAKHKFNVKQ